MANNKAVSSGEGSNVKRRRKKLSLRREKLGSFDKLAQELGVNVSYVYRFIKQGDVPVSKRVRTAMGIDVVSKGAEIYRGRSERAKAKGWSGLSEALTALDRGEWELPEKKIL